MSSFLKFAPAFEEFVTEFCSIQKLNAKKKTEVQVLSGSGNTNDEMNNKLDQIIISLADSQKWSNWAGIVEQENSLRFEPNWWKVWKAKKQGNLNVDKVSTPNKKANHSQPQQDNKEGTSQRRTVWMNSKVVWSFLETNYSSSLLGIKARNKGHVLYFKADHPRAKVSWNINEKES